VSQAATVLAAIAGALAAPALVGLGGSACAAAAAGLAPLASRGRASLERVLGPLRLAGSEGVIPSDRERLRLQVLAALGGVVLGTAIAGVRSGIALAAASAWLASRSLVWRRGRYRSRLDSGVSSAALALSDTLDAGHSVRGALAAAGEGLEGPIGLELRALARELEIGMETDSALERLRVRSRSRRVDLIVAAIRIQRRSGGGLASLLRETAATIEEHDRLEAEARAASSQARFTSLIVLVLPLFGLLLAEFASPGMLGRMTGSAVGIWLVGAALFLQVGGVLLIRRLSRVDD
jgi:tight adherence protein B